MLTSEIDLYELSKAELPLRFKLKRFAKERGIELTIAIVGLFIGIATVVVSYKVGAHQEILQASRMTDSYFNGIVDLFAQTWDDENKRINQLMIARTDAILVDLNRLNKPEKIASVIAFVSNLKPSLFYRNTEDPEQREAFIYLGDINIARSNLRNLDLEKATLSYSNLRGCDLAYTNLKSTILKGANLEEARLDYANFANANLQGANLHNASIAHASFDNANLEGAIWINGIRCKQGSIGYCVY